MVEVAPPAKPENERSVSSALKAYGKLLKWRQAGTLIYIKGVLELLAPLFHDPDLHAHQHEHAP